MGIISVQALIYCQRYEDAGVRCQDLLPGLDRASLEAEIAWRSGHLQASLHCLKHGQGTEGIPAKCRDLLHLVERLLSLEMASNDAADEGDDPF